MSRKDSLPSKRGRNVEFDDRRKEVFLKVFIQTNSVRQAAQAVQISPTTVYNHLKEFPDFKKAFDVANDEVLDILEAEALRRAVKGIKEPVYHQGRVVGYKLVYSDRLLEMLLRARDKRYGNQSSVEVKGSIDHNVNVSDVKEKLLEKIIERGYEIEGEAEEVIKEEGDDEQV